MAKCPATSLTLEYLRGMGYIADICERHVPSKPFPKKHDLFNLFDIVAIGSEEAGNPEHRRGVAFVQTTSASNRSSRRKKMEAEYEVMSRLTGPGKHNLHVMLITWKKVKGSWEPIVESVRSIEWGPDQHDHVHLEEVYSPSMKEIRALVRLREKKETAPAKRES